jgi:hypothetical protein
MTNSLTALLVIDPTTISFLRAAKLGPLKGLLKRTSALAINVGLMNDARASAAVCTITETFLLLESRVWSLSDSNKIKEKEYRS